MVSLEDWLPKSVAESFNSPAGTGKPIAPSFFNVSMPQWRSVLRRTVRCKLAVALPSDTCSVALSGGAFAVPKDEGLDRLTCDRRPQNSQESSVIRVFLPFCPRLRRLILERSQALGVHTNDTRNCFHLYQVDSSRWHTQVIGPRIPESWYTTSTTTPVTLSTLTIWKLFGNLTCADRLGTTNLTMAARQTQSRWKWLTDASSSTLECSALSLCCYQSAHCRKDQSSGIFSILHFPD